MRVHVTMMAVYDFRSPPAAVTPATIFRLMTPIVATVMLFRLLPLRHGF